MAVFYLDPEDGSDANNGTTFALRKKTIASATTPMGNGDELRVIAAPISDLGVCTWTDNSRTITIPAGLVQLIEDCNSGFTAAANVTAATNTSRKSGATSAELTVAATFTTGKIAHKALAAPLDLSGFQFVGFWVFATTQLALGAMELRLCSDATGDVPVATIPFDDGVGFVSANVWTVIAKDFGAGLPSGVNSIALYANTDPGTNTIRINNIVASKGKNASDHVSLTSAVSKQTVGEPEWYPLSSLTDTSVVVGGGASTVELTPPRPWRGATESVTTYAARGMNINSSTANRQPNASGTVTAPKRITGGWDRAAMSVQSGISWFNGKGVYASIIDSAIVKNYYTIEKLAGIYFLTACVTGLSTGVSVQLEAALGCVPVTESGQPGPSAIDVKQVWGLSAVLGLPFDTSLSAAKVTLGRIHGNTGTGFTYQNNAGSFEDAEVVVGMIDNNAGWGMGITDYSRLGAIYGTVFKNNALGDLRTSSSQAARLVAHNVSLGSATPISFAATDTATEIIVSAQDGDPTRHSRFRRHSTLTTDSTTRHTAAGVAWKLSLLNSVVHDINTPCTFRLADVAVRAGSPVTVKCWVRRDNAGLFAGIMARAGRIAGVPETRALAAAAINTWEQLTLTFTPTAAGVIPIFGFVYGSLFSAYFDDLEITQ